MRKLSLLLTCVGLFGVAMSWMASSVETDVGDHHMQAQNSLWCVGGANVSLSEDGIAVISPQTLLRQTFSDYSNFVVTIVNPALNTDTIDCSLLGQQIEVMVMDINTGNACWTTVLVEDKIKPTIVCTDYVLPCTADPLHLPDSFEPVVSDNCTPAGLIDLRLTHLSETALPCDATSPYIYRIRRTWLATDEYGSFDTCQQTILFERPMLSDVMFPPNDTLYCPDVDASVANLGAPTIGGISLDNSSLCMLAYSVEDDTLMKCDGSFGIRREFNVYDWCNGAQRTGIQLIDVLDTTPPVLICPANVTISANSNCEGSYIIRQPSVTDACTDLITIRTFVNGVLSQSSPVNLTLGSNRITHIASDDCGNLDSCTQLVTVEDQLAPTCAGCSQISVTLNAGGTASIILDSLRNCAFDAMCGTIVDTAIRRLTNTCNRPQDLVFGDEVHFCCEDQGQDIMIQVQLIDDSGNIGGCMFSVEVKGDAPVFDCPADQTISCATFDIDNDFGDIMFSSNCPASIQRDSTFTGLDDCGNGTYTRTWTVMSPGGQLMETCTQRITIENPFSFGLSNINFPTDVTIDCQASTAPSSTGSASFSLDPQDDCRTVMVSSRDSIPAGQPSSCYTLFRIWTVTDACRPGNPFVDVQRIDVEDTTIPLINCPPATDVPCLGDTSPVSTGFPTAADNCSGVLTNFTRTDVILPGSGSVLFTINRTWRVVDECGNPAECTQVIRVLDDGDPSIVCPDDITVNTDPGSCDANVNIPPPIASDCSGIGTITNDYNNTANASDVYPVGTTTVTFTITDNNGQSAQCSFTVTVIDNEDPVINCPADVTINCDGPLFPLSQFGQATGSDNCSSPGPVITEDTVVNTAGCLGGSVLRIFTITDAAGNSATCTQRITIQGTDILDSLDFVWPQATVEVTSCVTDISDVPVTFPSLITGAGACNVVTIDTTITMLTPAPLGCMAFNIAYTVTDSCNFNPATGAGRWVFNQTIALIDNDAPVFNAFPATDTFIADPNSCSALVQLSSISATDCNDFTITNNSNFANTNGANISGVYPEGVTTVTYTAEDKCGNISTRDVIIVVRDTVPPTLICLKFEYVLPDSNGLTLSAREISEDVTDNCTSAGDIIVTFTRDDLTDTTRFFNCDSAGREFRFLVWAIDGSGNTDSCTDVTGISDRNGVCPPSTPSTLISGQVRTSSGRAIEGASMIMETEGDLRETSTADRGEYTFERIMGDHPMKVEAELRDHILNGITAHDLSLIQRHILGILPLENGYLEMGADVNGDGSVDIRDIAVLRMALLGLRDDLPVPAWRFYDAQYDMNTIDPMSGNIPSHLMIYDEGVNFDADFIGIKAGDMDYSVELDYTATSGRSSAEIVVELNPMPITHDDADVKVAIVMGGDEAILGGQMHINLPRGYQMTDVQPNESLGLSHQNVNTSSWDDRALRMVWSNTDAIHPGDIVCWVTVPREAMSKIWTLREDFTAELFDSASRKFGVRLKQGSLQITSDVHTESEAHSFALYQNVPNPFTQETVIRFELPSPSTVTLSLFDATGSLLHSERRQGQTGMNEIRLNSDVLGSQSGMIYYQVNTDEYSAIRKMMRLK